MCGCDGREQCFFFMVVLDDTFFVEVFIEDPRSQLDGVLAKVVGSLCGTRDAPMIWQDCLRCQVKLLGFTESLRVPCVFYHETKGVEMVAHVARCASWTR